MPRLKYGTKLASLELVDGGVICSRQSLPGTVISLLFSDHFVSSSTGNLLFLNK